MQPKSLTTLKSSPRPYTMPRSHWLTIWASFRTARSSFRSSMKQPLRLRSNAITNGGNVVEILFPAIKPGRIARVETLSIQNLSGETVNASFGIISQGVYQAVYTLPAVSNATAWAGYFPLYLLEGDTLAWHVKGTSLSGQVDFLVSGWMDDYPAMVTAAIEIQQ